MFAFAKAQHCLLSLFNKYAIILFSRSALYVFDFFIINSNKPIASLRSTKYFRTFVFKNIIHKIFNQILFNIQFLHIQSVRKSIASILHAFFQNDLRLICCFSIFNLPVMELIKPSNGIPAPLVTAV